LDEDVAPVEQHASTAAAQGNPVTAEPVEESVRPAESAISVGSESFSAQDDHTADPDSQLAFSAPAALTAPADPQEIQREMSRPTSRHGQPVNLRIARDSERCPNVVCYKWHLVAQRLKPPHYTKVDLAGLRLAPDLRQGVDNGDIDLIIEAVPQHKTINGHHTLIFVATNLTGVTPHEGPP
jgi:hypothetical protein